MRQLQLVIENEAVSQESRVTSDEKILSTLSSPE